MPLTDKGKKILKSMQKRYGKKQGERVFYASKNKGTIKGVEKTAKLVRDSKGQLRDYKKEYKYHAKPEQLRNRSLRNKARRALGLKPGDKREVDHKKPLSKGGSNALRNLRALSRKANREKFTS